MEGNTSECQFDTAYNVSSPYGANKLKVTAF